MNHFNSIGSAVVTAAQLLVLLSFPAHGVSADEWPQPAFSQQTQAPAPARASSYRVEHVARGLVRPFSLAFLPEGRFIVTERRGAMRVIEADGRLSAPLRGVPVLMPPKLADPYFASGALYDICLDREFSRTRFVYFNYRAGKPGYPLTIARAKLSGDRRSLDQLTLLYESPPRQDPPLGLDGRLLCAADGTLFVTVSSSYDEQSLPQQLDNVYGKVLHLDANGAAVSDNPFVGRKGALPEIYSYGHRDPQGIAVQPSSAQLWTIEHGPKGGDELNLLRAEANYGWPVISYGRKYSGAPVGAGITAAKGMEQPVYYWTPDIAPTGLQFYSGTLFPDWKGNLFTGALVGKALLRLVIRDGRVVAEERLLSQLGQRIRDVRQGPEGALYVLTDPRAPMGSSPSASGERERAEESKGELLRLLPKRYTRATVRSPKPMPQTCDATDIGCHSSN